MDGTGNIRKCVIFDMDGVITDSEPLHQKCEKDMFRLLGINVTDEEHNSLVGASDETIWTRLDSLHSLPVTINEAVQLKKTMYDKYLKQDNNLQPLPYVSELIGNLVSQGFFLALASSSPRMQIDYILDKFNFDNYFNAIICGDDVKNGKPHPEIFLKTAKLLDINPESCVVIEDSHNGITAAKKARMKCIGYLNPNSGNQDLSNADLLISSFKELSVKIIDQLFAKSEIN